MWESAVGDDRLLSIRDRGERVVAKSCTEAMTNGVFVEVVSADVVNASSAIWYCRSALMSLMGRC